MYSQMNGIDKIIFIICAVRRSVQSICMCMCDNGLINTNALQYKLRNECGTMTMDQHNNNKIIINKATAILIIFKRFIPYAVTRLLHLNALVDHPSVPFNFLHQCLNVHYHLITDPLRFSEATDLDAKWSVSMQIL